MPSSRLFVVGAVSTVGFVAAARGQSITSIGVLTGHTQSWASGISANGNVVVGWSDGLAVRWVPPGTLTSLGTLPTGTVSLAHAVSSTGSVIVGAGTVNGAADIVAFSWTQAGGMIALPGPATYGRPEARDVNSTGSMIVGSYYVLPGNTYFPRGALWTGAGLTTLTPPAGSVGWDASGITPNGAFIVGHAAPFFPLWPDLYRPVARIWSSATTSFSLGTLPGGIESLGMAISDDGQAATGFGDNGIATVAFRWTASGGMEDLGLLQAPGEFTSEGVAITADGLVVLGSGYNIITNSVRAAMSTPNGLVDLNDYLPQMGVDLTGWVLNQCNGVSTDGTVLCGSGTYFGQRRGWVVRDIPPICAPRIWTQPEPTKFCVGSSGFLSVAASPPHASTFIFYQWYEKVGQTSIPVADGITNGGSWITGSYTPTLFFNPGYNDIAGNYYCVVSGGCAPTQSSIVSVSLTQAAPIPWPNPLSLSICPPAGGGWVVTGSVPSDGPYTHLWYFESPVNSNNWLALTDGPTALSFGVAGGIVSGSSTTSLSIVAAPNMTLKAAHSTRYRCRVFNHCGFTDSLPATLNICIGDTNCDGVVEDGDFVDFAAAYNIFDCEDPNMPAGCPADMNGDGYVDDDDFVLFANAYDNFSCP